MLTAVKEENFLRPINRDELLKFAEAGKANPDRRGTNKVKTVSQGVFRSWRSRRT